MPVKKTRTVPFFDALTFAITVSGSVVSTNCATASAGSATSAAIAQTARTRVRRAMLFYRAARTRA